MLTCQIVYHNQNCLNTKKSYAKTCRLCIEACPHQAISEYKEIDTKKCTECGACMAICPSDGMVDRNTDKLHEYIESSQAVVLNCPQAIPAGFEIPCLGVIDRDLWMALMLAAREKEVKLHTGKCADCPDKKACVQSVKLFKEVHADWPDHPPVLIQVSPDTGEEAPKGAALSKPQNTDLLAKGAWKKKGWEKLESILPGLTADESYSIPRTRQLLARHIELTPEAKIPLPALKVGSQCTNCGVCAAICPQTALSKKENGDELSLIYEPYKCVRCQRCVNICNPKALSFGTKPLSHRHFTGKILIHQGSPRHCTRCGKQVFDNSEPPMCIACASVNAYDSASLWSKT
jgi:ferredoxin